MRNRKMHRAIVVCFFSVLSLSACPKPPTLESLKKTCPKTIGDPTMTESQMAWVTKVADGDTFTACLMPGQKGKIRVRILGIDCPESHANAKCKSDEKKGRSICAEQIPRGLKAKNIAKSLLYDRAIYLESRNKDGKFEKDPFGRWLAYVRTKDGQDFGEWMIRQGLCENYQWKYPHPRGAEYGEPKP